MESDLTSFFYLYGVGGALFVGTLTLAWNRKAIDPTREEDRSTLYYLFLGYAVYIVYHAVSQFILPGLGIPS